MSGFFGSWRRKAAYAALLVGAVVASAGPAGAAPAASSATYTVGPVLNVSSRCAVQNAESEQAVDAASGDVYEVWMGCRGIGFARSTDRGATFGAPISLPGPGSQKSPWDPAITVAPNGTVYASFMVAVGGQSYPVVDVSTDHGVTFKRAASVVPPDPKNWGDRDFIAAGPDGTLYLTWDYGPSAASVTFICDPNGSCSFSTGQLNAVLQTSTDGGRTWSAMSYISPGFPNSGADSAPMVVEPGGVIDVTYQGYDVTNVPTDDLGVAYTYFSSSADHGKTWSAPVKIGAAAGSMNTSEWWIDGALSADSAQNLYATWDTQGTNPDGTANDVGWLSYSTDHGRTWSAPTQVAADRENVPHITQSVGGGPGVAYVSWLSNSDARGYAQYLRAFSVTSGWLSAPVQVSSAFGAVSVWPGDTFGISALSPTEVVLSWGSAVAPDTARADVFTAVVQVRLC